ncbi:No pollen germination related 2 [Hibiscus syriacus]|uniref:No pollen germination related 2 n=1 Tax=Hibiscus syriacus TaxID=106335 RepID=A0A6A2WAL6_HIBSY|nr:No pollen germination related 2 [Hibiscus syriacus]
MTRELNIEKSRVEDLKGKNSRLLKSLEKEKQKMKDFEVDRRERIIKHKAEHREIMNEMQRERDRAKDLEEMKSDILDKFEGEKNIMFKGFESEMNHLIAELEVRGQRIEEFNVEKEKWELERKNFNTKLEVEQEVASNWMQRCRNKNVQIHKLNQRTQEARTKLEEDLDQSRNKNSEFNAYILQLEESLFQEKVRLGPSDLKEKITELEQTLEGTNEQWQKSTDFYVERSEERSMGIRGHEPIYHSGTTPIQINARTSAFQEAKPDENRQVDHASSSKNPLISDVKIGDFNAEHLIPDLNELNEKEKINEELTRHIRSLEERMKSVEITESFYGFDASELSLVSDLILPIKFKVPEFDRYDDMVPDRWTLQNLEKKNNETFKQYAQRWRDTVAQVQPPLSEKEATVIFVHTLKAPYLNHLMGNATRNFADLVISGELIENVLKSGKIESNERSSSKRPMYRKKENEVNNANSYKKDLSKSVTITQPRVKKEETNTNRVESRGSRKENERLSFTPLPVPYAEIYDSLLKADVIRPYPLVLMQPPFPQWVVQNLINTGKLEFNSPSTSNHPLPNHGDKNVNAIQEENRKKAKTDVSEIKSPFVCIFQQLSLSGKREDDVCSSEDSKPNQRTSDPVFINVKSSTVIPAPTKPKVVITTPLPFPYKDTRRKWEMLLSRNIQCIRTGESKRKSHGNTPKGAHRNALMRMLNQTFIPEDISLNKLDRIMGHIAADNYVTFTDDEIPEGGMGSVKALNITTHCHGHVLPGVLIDNGSALNLMPLVTLHRMPVNKSHMKSYQNVVRAFDGTKKEVLGKMEISLLIEPVVYNIDFVKLKFVVDGQLICVGAEEEIIASITSDILYIETNEDALECSFRALEFVNATFIAEGSKIPHPRLFDCTKMIVRQTLGIGAKTGKGLGKNLQGSSVPVSMKMKKDHFGLGFKPNFQQKNKEMKRRCEDRKARLKGEEILWEHMFFPQLKTTFRSGETINVEQQLVEAFKEEKLTKDQSIVEEAMKGLFINMIMNDNKTDKYLARIRPCFPGETLNNWTAEDLPVVFNINTECHNVNSMFIPKFNREINLEHPICLEEINECEDELECDVPTELLRLVEKEDKQILPHKEEIKTVNLGTNEEIKEVKIGNTLTIQIKQELINLLQEFKDIFAWSYQDMPGLSTNIVMHKLPINPEYKPVQQKLRRMRPEMLLQIKEEVMKQINAGFLQAAKYPEWVANIVPVPKKNGKVRMCVDYRDLNKASLKDSFPLPHKDTLVDNTAGHAWFSFMDGFSGYNQIKMNPEDMEKTTFVTMWGTFCYKVMPFGLKNAGATYQRAMVTLFHDMMHKEIEVYVDDMIAKSRTEEEHIQNLRKLFQRLRKYQLKLNPIKCTFGVTSGKLLGFVVSKKGIEIDPDKVKAIQDLPPPNIKKEPLSFNFPDEDLLCISMNEEVGTNDASWKLYFDGAYNTLGRGIGAVLISSENIYYPFTSILEFFCTNNMAEYEACVMGLKAAIKRKIKCLKIYGDSSLVVYQLRGEWETKDPKLLEYRNFTLELVKEFERVTFNYLPREENQMEDALATLAAMFQATKKVDMMPIKMQVYEILAHCYSVEEEVDGKPWYYDILQYIKNQSYPQNASEIDKRTLRRMAAGYFLDGETMYRRSNYQMLLRCLNTSEARSIIEKVHSGICGTHANDKIHVPPSSLHVMTTPWPFSMWGIDVIGAITPKASNGHCFILVAIDYFTKKIITDNALNLNNKMMTELCVQVKIKHANSVAYRPNMNGAVEAANKNIKRIITKTTETYKDWHEKLPFALYAYRTTVRTSTGATPFSLVYGMEAVLPIEMYQKRMMKSHDKKVHPREFQEGDLVLKKILPIHKDFRGKWMPNWEGPYVVKKAFSGEVLILAEMDGKILRNPINSDSVKKYYA